MQSGRRGGESQTTPEQRALQELFLRPPTVDEVVARKVALQGASDSAMDDFASDTDSDYTSYWRDWVSENVFFRRHV